MSDDDDDDDLAAWRPDPDERRCPECGSPQLLGDWWDDLPDAGGACIGTLHQCVNDACNWFDSH